MDAKINIMIVGSPKSGTTSILRNLAAHKDISTHMQAEFGYFLNDNTFSDGWDKAVERFFGKDLRKILLAKHVVLMYFEKSRMRLFEHNPSVQVILLLRNPVNRAYSEFWYSRKQGWEEIDSFEEAIALEKKKDLKGWNGMRPRSYIFHSIYYPHVKRLFEIFPAEQVQVFLTEDLKNDARTVYANILDRVGLQFDSMLDTGRYNEAAKPRYPKLARIYAKVVYAPDSLLKRTLRLFLPKKMVDRVKKSYVDWNRETLQVPELSSQMKEQLITYFKPDNQLLSEFLHRDLSFWDS